MSRPPKNVLTLLVECVFFFLLNTSQAEEYVHVHTLFFISISKSKSCTVSVWIFLIPPQHQPGIDVQQVFGGEVLTCQPVERTTAQDVIFSRVAEAINTTP